MKRRGFGRSAGGRTLLAVLATVAAAALLPGMARANTYNVTACNDAPGSVNHSWTTWWNSPYSTITLGQGCPSAGYQPGDQNNTNHGIVARYIANSWDPNGAAGGFQFTAPAGNNIASVTLSDWYTRANSGQYAVMLSDYGPLEGCWESATSLCGAVNAAHTLSVGGSGRIWTEVGCHNSGSCSDSGNGQSGLFTMYGTTVTVNDLTAPTSTPSGPLWTNAWQGGARSLTISGRDSGDGIQRNDVKIDGSTVIQGPVHGCDFTYPHPCGDQTDSFTYDTHQLSDGPHSIQAVSWDAAWMAGVANGTLYVDNHAPDMSTTPVSVAQGSEWTSSNGFDLSWTTPASQFAPIVKAHYSVCRAAAPSDCPVADAAVGGSGIETISGLRLPSAGDYLVRVWLEDGVGNVNPGLASVPVHLRYDPTVPGRAEVARLRGWLSAAEATSYSQRIELAAGASTGPSGIAGYSVTTDGSFPDATVEAAGQAAVVELAGLPEGRNVVRARAVSGARVPSGELGEAELNVDRSKPEASVSGSPDPAVWQRSPVSLLLTGTDQAHLSGMDGIDPADPTASATDEAFVEYRLDGGPATAVPGTNAPGVATETVPLSVVSDGQHSVTYRAVDLAGNESAERTVQFKIDQTPPEVVAFEAQDPIRPTAVSVAVADRTSGVAGGSIRMRRQGASTWTELPTRFDGGHLVTVVDDSQLAPGAYEFQATARDIAGNERSSDRRRDGGAEVLVAPFRFDTRMTAGIVRPAVKKKAQKVSARCRRSKRCMAGVRRRALRKPPAGTVRSLTVAYGKTAVVKGTLLSADLRPIAGQSVGVYRRLEARGQGLVRIATVRTDSAGRFQYRAPKGASRTLRFQFAGTETLHPAAAEVRLLVRASSTLRVSRTRVLNGGSVRFSGTIGLPVVQGAKIVELQAFYRRRWRTFAAPSTSGRGRWKFTYRFEATSGVVTYRFRVRIRHEASYPYELGYSRAVAVRVSGR